MPNAVPASWLAAGGRYEVQGSIGWCIGAGEVRIAKDTKENEVVTMRRIGRLLSDKYNLHETLKEVKLLSFLSHDHVVGIRDVFVRGADYYCVMDYMPADLKVILQSRQVLTPEHHMYFVLQIACALKYVHSAGVAHGNLCPHSVLVNESCHVMLSNFSMSQWDSDNLETDRGDRWYLAPEKLVAQDATRMARQSDMWSLGCIFCEMILRRPLLPGRDYIDQLKHIVATIGAPTEEDITALGIAECKRAVTFFGTPMCAPPTAAPLATRLAGTAEHAVDFIGKLLQYNVERRMTAAEALEHPYLRDMHDVLDLDDCEDVFDMAIPSAGAELEDIAAELMLEVEKYKV